MSPSLFASIIRPITSSVLSLTQTERSHGYQKVKWNLTKISTYSRLICNHSLSLPLWVGNHNGSWVRFQRDETIFLVIPLTLFVDGLKLVENSVRYFSSFCGNSLTFPS